MTDVSPRSYTLTRSRVGRNPKVICSYEYTNFDFVLGSFLEFDVTSPLLSMTTRISTVPFLLKPWETSYDFIRYSECYLLLLYPIRQFWNENTHSFDSGPLLVTTLVSTSGQLWPVLWVRGPMLTSTRHSPIPTVSPLESQVSSDRRLSVIVQDSCSMVPAVNPSCQTSRYDPPPPFPSPVPPKTSLDPVVLGTLLHYCYVGMVPYKTYLVVTVVR